MALTVKLYITDDEGEKYMGYGVLWLLEEIEKSGSLRQAAMNIGLSYSKAYGMMTKLEKALGCSIIDRKKGGVSRAGSAITPFAHKYIELYRAFQKEAKEQCEALYRDFEKQADQLRRSEDARE